MSQSQERKERKIPMGEMPLHSKPFENVAVDLVEPLPRTREGYKYILTYICLSSGYPDARPLKTVMASEVVEALLDIFRRASRGQLFTGRGRCGKSHILSCACMYYCILCYLLRMHSFTYIIYSRLCFVNSLRD